MPPCVRGDEPPGLIEGRLPHGGEVQQGGQLFGEMLNQVHFPVEVEDFPGQGAAFGLFGRKVRQQTRRRPRQGRAGRSPNPGWRLRG